MLTLIVLDYGHTWNLASMLNSISIMIIMVATMLFKYHSEIPNKVHHSNVQAANQQ